MFTEKGKLRNNILIMTEKLFSVSSWCFCDNYRGELLETQLIN